MIKKFSYLFIIILALFAVLFFWFSISISKPKTPSVKKEEVAPLDYKKLEKLEGLKSPGQPVSATEPGFGREDPFVPY
jgi:hypothetical protein